MEPLPVQKKRRALSVPTILFKLNNNSNNNNKAERIPESADTDSRSQSTSYNYQLVELQQTASNGSNPRLTSKQAIQLRSNMLPYRENGVLKYMPPSGTSLSPPNHAHDQISLASGHSSDGIYGAPNMYDSDCEPLIMGSGIDLPLDDDAMMRFTATGRPMPVFKPSALANLGGHMFIAPQHLPQRYTDESVIPVIVRLNQKSAGVESGSPPTSRRKSFLGKLKGDKDGNTVKVVYMPRGEYLKYFARDQSAQYIGTEPEQQWTEGELEERYGKYTKFSLKGQ